MQYLLGVRDLYTGKSSQGGFQKLKVKSVNFMCSFFDLANVAVVKTAGGPVLMSRG